MWGGEWVGGVGGGVDLLKRTSESTRAHTLGNGMAVFVLAGWALARNSCRCVMCCRYRRRPLQQNCLELETK